MGKRPIECIHTHTHTQRPSDGWHHHGSYLLDGFQSGHCGERCGRHFPDVHIYIAAVFAHCQRGIFLRDVFCLFDIFGGLFNLRLAVHNRVGHCIQVMMPVQSPSRAEPPVASGLHTSLFL